MVSDLKRVDKKDEQKKPDGDYFEMQVFTFSVDLAIQFTKYIIPNTKYVPLSRVVEGENGCRPYGTKEFVKVRFGKKIGKLNICKNTIFVFMKFSNISKPIGGFFFLIIRG